MDKRDERKRTSDEASRKQTCPRYVERTHFIFYAMLNERDAIPNVYLYQ